MHVRATAPERAAVMLHLVINARKIVERLGAAGAARNALAELDGRRIAMAEVDSVVARLHRRGAGKERPAA